jgi:NAD(P)H-flavin reductase
VRVLEKTSESPGVVTLTLEAGPGRERPFRPGQFSMLYAFGVGEVPISMSGDPARLDVLVHTIKAVGAVTRALCQLEQGSAVGMRGPFGMPWPMDELVGADLIIVAGGLGLAPLRPVLYRIFEQRAAYGSVHLLVGARTPEDLLFHQELELWKSRGDITVLVTVDRAATGWSGRVGVVPALLSELEMSSKQAVALLCGPEVMMRFTLRELFRRGLAEERIYLSMERNMKCAIGFCGHCQYGPSFICKDGPVFRYDRIRSLFWLREV